MLRRVERYAARRIQGLDKAGFAVDDYAARELVQDALHDTVTGVIHWDHTRKQLDAHLLDILQVRTKRLRRKAERYRHLSLSAQSSDDASAQDEIDAALVEQAPRRSVSSYAAEVMAELRELAASDELVLRMLDAFDQGASKRAEVIQTAKFSLVQYHNARRRLDRLVARLSSGTRPSRGQGDQ